MEKIANGIYYFISNAGAAKGFNLNVDTTRDSLLDNLITNTVGPISVLQKLYPYLKRKETKKVLFVTSIR